LKTVLEEALRDGVVPAVAFAAHAGLHMMPGQQGALGVAGIMAAPIRMHHRTHRRLPLGNGRLQARFFHGKTRNGHLYQFSGLRRLTNSLRPLVVQNANDRSGRRPDVERLVLKARFEANTGR